MYLATDEDERRWDDPPVFNKCVFHLVGEESAEEKVSQREQGRGRETPRKGVEQTLREGNRELQWERHPELRDAQGVGNSGRRKSKRKKERVKELANMPV